MHGATKHGHGTLDGMSAGTRYSAVISVGNCIVESLVLSAVQLVWTVRVSLNVESVIERSGWATSVSGIFEKIRTIPMSTPMEKKNINAQTRIIAVKMKYQPS